MHRNHATLGESMRSAKHGLRALGLAVLAVMGMMAFTAAGAQAALPGESTAGEFLINLGIPLLATFTGGLTGTASFLVEARNLKIECSSLDVPSGKFNSATDAQAELVLLGCLSFTHTGVHLSECQFKELETIRLLTLILPILHGGLVYLLFEPIPPSTVLGTPSYKVGCILPLNNPITGSITALLKELDAVNLPLLFSHAIQLLTGDEARFGGLPMHFNAQFNYSLTGAHAGQKIGAH